MSVLWQKSQEVVVKMHGMRLIMLIQMPPTPVFAAFGQEYCPICFFLSGSALVIDEDN